MTKNLLEVIFLLSVSTAHYSRINAGNASHYVPKNSSEKKKKKKTRNKSHKLNMMFCLLFFVSLSLTHHLNRQVPAEARKAASFVWSPQLFTLARLFHPLPEGGRGCPVPLISEFALFPLMNLTTLKSLNTTFI